MPTCSKAKFFSMPQKSPPTACFLTVFRERRPPLPPRFCEEAPGGRCAAQGEHGVCDLAHTSKLGTPTHGDQKGHTKKQATEAVSPPQITTKENTRRTLLTSYGEMLRLWFPFDTILKKEVLMPTKKSLRTHTQGVSNRPFQRRRFSSSTSLSSSYPQLY